MRKVTTILCSIAFMISGIMMAISASDPSSSSGYKSLSAATMPNIGLAYNTGSMGLSESLEKDVAKNGVRDTVYITKTDTIKEQVTKVKVKKVPVPSNIMEINVTSSHRTDTVQVPVYYLATQVGNKEGPTGECISIYEVHKVDEICTGTTNSYVEDTNEYHIMGDD